MKRNSATILSLAALAVMVLDGCGHKADRPTEAPPVKVTVMAVGAADGSDGGSSAYSGTVAAASDATVSFSVPGTIEQLNVGEGQRVSRGQVLGRLKTGDYSNANNIAQAELAEAQDAYDRLKKLHDARALPDIKWVEVQQKLKQARNAADMAARTLGETILRSPMAGVVSRKLADRGQNVAPMEPVYEIVSADELDVEISVPETEINSFALGRAATVTVQGVEPLRGSVVQKAAVADPLTRAYMIKVSVPSASGRVLPGMVADVVFDPVAPTASEGDAPQVFRLPSQAVTLADDNRTFVWIVKAGKAERRFVVADELVAEGVLVREGLAPGDTVIVEGMQKVGTGSRVDAILKR